MKWQLGWGGLRKVGHGELGLGGVVVKAGRKRTMTESQDQG
jgi:hypothetical protein